MNSAPSQPDIPLDIPIARLGQLLPPRPPDSHKGDFGNAGILGGAPGMAGAALLAGRAALWMGAGRVYCGLLDDRPACDPMQPELMLTTPEQVLRITAPGCLAVGPGLGQSEQACRHLEQALANPLPLLLDADALNLLARDPELARRLSERPATSLLTPHPGEAARLLQVSTADIQADRPAAARELARRYRAICCLKGAGTLIQAPDGRCWRNATGNPGMAAPGMGDVLTGIICGLTAQGLPLLEAALLGAHLHGAAGDAAVATGQGPRGLTAGEVTREARRLLNSR